jgi:hypothetical protein
MRLSIFIGLLYVAWCINPTTFDSLKTKQTDLFIIGYVIVMATIGDFKQTFPTQK